MGADWRGYHQQRHRRCPKAIAIGFILKSRSEARDPYSNDRAAALKILAGVARALEFHGSHRDPSLPLGTPEKSPLTLAGSTSIRYINRLMPTASNMAMRSHIMGMRVFMPRQTRS